MKLNVQTIHSAIVVLLTTITAISITSCGRKIMTDEEASHWIAAYTPTHIDMDSKIRIELTDAMKAKVDTNAQLAKFFDFSPSTKGDAKLSADKRFIDFTPAKSLKQGTKYECRINLKGLSGVDSLGDFRFDFYVDKRELRFKDVVATVDPDDTSEMIVSGTLEYSVRAGDTITADNSIICCDYPNSVVSISEKTTSNSRRFSITGLKRGEEMSTVRISTNPMHGFSKSEVEIEIPSIADFSILNSERVNAAEPYINLNFSSPLSSQQDLDGLITIDKIDDLRLERDGCNVKVYYPQNAIADITLRLSELIKNIDGRRLDENAELHFKQEVIPPAVEIPFRGSILPDNNNLKLPFRAVNLAAVDVEVVKIFPSNVMAFLQENDINGTHEQRRFGRLIFHRTVRLDKDKLLNLHQWQNFSIDLKGLFRRERGAIYNVRITFRKAYSLYDRAEPVKFEEVTNVTQEEKRTWEIQWPYIYRNNPDSKWANFKWNDKDDPTKDSYFMNADMPERNLVASNLGLIAKKGATDEYIVTVTDLITASSASGVEVSAYNYQLQKIASAITDSNGFATVRTKGRPFILTASDGQSTTYLKVTFGNELSLSNFDVSGKEVVDGIKGFTYGDRGVWRPGDDVHLTLILEDKQGSLPNNYPVTMELYTPSEQLYSRQTLTGGTDGFYVFNIPTDESVPTGSWDAQFKVGNQTFHHKVRIETIKPNRLKLDIITPEIVQANIPQEIGLSARWLTGPVAKNMSASIEMTLYSDSNPFKNFKNHTFSNPLLDFTSSQQQILQGQLDSLGYLKKIHTIGADINSPGMLRANFTAKVTEPGGDVSVTSKSLQFSPFGVYVGIDLSKKEYTTDTDLKFQVVAVNQKGARMKMRELDYKIYYLNWDWWWEGSASALNRYVKSSSANLVAQDSVTAVNGFATIPFRANESDWGKYLILVRDRKGGHATGGVIFIDSPDWEGRSNRKGAAASTELSFTLDKKTYEVGETANLYLPECKGGKVLLSVENGSRVIRRYWVNTSATGETCFKLPVDGSMVPNFYVSATLLRPHSMTGSDVPIRLFGVTGASVIDRRTILHPEIEMPEELHPQQTFTIRVREQDNKPMTYTLALVDEGLLDITNFKTPRPWPAMNQREALGVKTWDMYDAVIGAFGSKFSSILSIGGDEALRNAAGKEKRFNPVVKFIGPFILHGGTKAHKITLPNYVGSVRVMVVAAHAGAYGNADKTVKVTSPLMLLTTLPRTLSCGDVVDMPVNVFAMDEGIHDVSVNVEVSGPVTLSGVKSRKLSFSSTGEKLVDFKLACSDKVEGTARIIVSATSGDHHMADTTFISVKNPMPILTDVTNQIMNPGESVTLSWNPKSAKDVALQISAMPTLSFGGAMEFFGNYPHLCSEQLSSKALFMLYGRRYLSPEEQSKCETELPKIMKLLLSRQLPDGGFVYWPGNTEVNTWVTSLAGLAMTEANRQGFRISKQAMDKWVEFQQKEARNYKYSESTDLGQAFRLYSLSKAGSPLKAAMNRLRESKKLSQTAAYCLASAYALDGRTDVATKLIERAERTHYETREGMFESPQSDEAIKLEAYALSKNRSMALSVARSVANQCSGSDYVTQDVALATIAMQSLVEIADNGNISAEVTEKGRSPMLLQNISFVKNLYPAPSCGEVKVSNVGKNSIALSLTNTYQPSPQEKLKEENSGLSLAIAYTDMTGKPISVTSLKQDTEFYATITITNHGSDIPSMALTYCVPSGWEIWNNRLHGTDEKQADYRDIRDDKIIHYSALESGKKMAFRIRLRATYSGKFLLPPMVCEDMYNPACRAVSANSWVSVEK